MGQHLAVQADAVAQLGDLLLRVMWKTVAMLRLEHGGEQADDGLAAHQHRRQIGDDRRAVRLVDPSVSRADELAAHILGGLVVELPGDLFVNFAPGLRIILHFLVLDDDLLRCI